MRGIVAVGRRHRAVSALVALAVGSLAPVSLAVPAQALTTTPGAISNPAPALASAPSGTVWLCRPGKVADPCTSSLQTRVVQPTGAVSIVTSPIGPASKFDCFYVYPTVSLEQSLNADLRTQKTEVATAIAQAARFSTVCRVWAPMYHQFTLFALEQILAHGISASDLTVLETAYQSLKSGFEDYLAHDNDGRPIVFIGHSQGASLLVSLLSQVVDNDAALRSRLVLAILPGANVVVPDGARQGGSFSHIPVCSSVGQAGCVIAYSSFPGPPPTGSLFGRPGQGVSVLSGQFGTKGVHVVCVNPAALGGGSAALDPYFPTEGLISTPWVEYPQLYRAHCASAGGATWLQVTKISATSDRRPVVTEPAGPAWGYHDFDINLALGNLVADTAAAERTWSRRSHG